MKLFKKKYDILILLGVLFVLTSFCLYNHEPLDIHLHDTYIVIAFEHIFWIFAFISFLVWVLYKLLNKFLVSELLTRMHVTFTVLLLVINAVLLLGNFGMTIQNSSYPRIYNDFSSFNILISMFDLFGKETKVLMLLSTILVLGQLIFPINLLVGLISRLRK